MYIIQPKGSCTVLIPYIDQRKKDRERVYPKRNTEKGFKRERERERERGGGCIIIIIPIHQSKYFRK